MKTTTKVLTKLLAEGKIDMIGINIEQIEQLIKTESEREEEEFWASWKTPYTPPSFDVEFHSDWDSLIFWRPMNWRNFTLVKIDGETNDYSKYLELEIALLGFHIEVNWYRSHGEKERKD